MPQSRKNLISLEATPYYHLVSRCVRRAFLCGFDKFTGKSFEHRRAWLENRILKLSSIFTINLCAYAIMHNHYHLVVHINKKEAEALSNREVVERWHQLFKGITLSQRYLDGEALSFAEYRALSLIIDKWRGRLLDIGWFMRCINEPLARMANIEDECTGRFWEGRYKSQALLDEKALAACMAYVDLNPIRSSIAKMPEKSDYTSIKLRIRQAKLSKTPSKVSQQPWQLFPFIGKLNREAPPGLPFRLTEYLELIDWTAQRIQHDSEGFNDDKYPSILYRLGISSRQWKQLSINFEKRFSTFVGSFENVKSACHLFGRLWSHSYKQCHALLT